ncbi:MBL fold metallo-hydrolase [Limnohabitans sp. Rim8]|uniref:MBL fold metallo-hydrolase n=1 Tax=Limnohabitans sp. Rim8 TaxID=1100718 RepID=UPI000D34DADA|nr:MBL fold metallo-hydrolase [Limnohabitans sp. Rim8]PUE55940.1 MBL fold metallo-hydrolase [Limnohabitans sp. Rim8]
MLRFKSLGSGSSGNATLVEAQSGAHTTRLLIDCGLRLRDLEARLIEAGTCAEDLDAIFITHEHGDHIGCARSFIKRYSTPLWMSQGTWLAVSDGGAWTPYQHLLNVARDSSAIELGDLQAMPFTVPHDAREPLQLRCTDGHRHLGVITDLGHVSSHVVASLQGCHALLLEANHDPDLLQASGYPVFLKQRVSGPWGHLANHAAADLLARVKHDQLSCVLAAHLSERNNTPELARTSLCEAMGCSPLDIDVADPLTGSDWLVV